MRKIVIDAIDVSGKSTEKSMDQWLDLEEIASVEVTSEDSQFPVDHALGQPSSTGWRASAKGPQLLRLNFDQPTTIRRIHLHFAEHAADRCQEFAVYAKSEGGEMREVVRQQYAFSPGGSTEETEDYTVNLDKVTTLELRIDPDRSHDPTHSQHFASVQSLRLA